MKKSFLIKWDEQYEVVFVEIKTILASPPIKLDEAISTTLIEGVPETELIYFITRIL